MSMLPQILLSILLTTLVFTLSTATNSSSIQYKPLPTINESQLFSLANSPADNMLLLSNQLQTLKLTHFSNPSGSGNLTNITLKHFNRSASGKVSTYTLTIIGNWTYAQSAYNSHSCNGLYETTNNLLGPLHFDKQKGEFTLLAQIPIQLLTGDPSTTIEQIRTRVNVGDHCKLLSYNHGSIFRVLTPNANLTDVLDVTLPVNSTPKVISHDLTLAVWDNHLYSYDNSTLSFAPVYTLPVTDRYTIKNRESRAVVSCVVSKQVSVGVLQTNYTFYVLDLNRGSNSLIGNFSIENVVQLANGTGLQFYLSPKATKLGIGYQHQASFVIMAKHIDYYQNKLINLTFSNLTETMHTVTNIDYSREFSISDEFVVVKNVSKYANGASHPYPAAEQTYQVIGTKIVMLRRRTLSNSQELTKFVKAFVDSTVTEQCYVVQIYNGTSSGSYQVVQFQYGNLLSNYQTIKSVAPFFIDFAQPSSVNTYRSGHHLEWVFQIHQNGSHNFTALWYSNATSNNTETASLVLGSTWTVHHQNFKCLLVEISNGGTILLYRLNKASHQYEFVSTLTNLLNGMNLTNATMSSSHDCTRLRVNNNLYLLRGSDFVVINNTVSWVTVDLDLTVLMMNNGSLLKLDTASASFNFYANTALTTNPASCQLETANNHIAVIGQSATTAEVFIYADDTNNNPKRIFDFSYVGYSGIPQVAFSPNLTKIVIVGTVNSSLKIDSFNIDYSSLTSNTVDFPLETITGASTISIVLGQSFLYARQSQMKKSSDIGQQYVYFLSGNIYPRLIFRNNITTATKVSWFKTVIVQLRRDYALLMVENINMTTTPASVQVIRTELWGNQGNYDHGIQHYVVEISNGSAQVCSTGCQSCDCQICFQGYFRDSLTSTCRPCGYSCASCDSINTNICHSCFSGAYLDTVTRKCLPCLNGCISCTDNISCTICPPGQFLSNGSCYNCSKDCFNCSDPGICLTCRIGYTLVSNANGSVTCGTCSVHCSKCNSSNITQCLSCSKGMFMNNGICQSCSSNCLACTGPKICDVCIPGYMIDAVGKCSMKCQLPCLGCYQGHPTLCTSCQKGSILNKTTKLCQIDLSCNANNNCSDCGQGLNHILMQSPTGATCQICPNITNCIQCDYINTYRCAICSKGYFSNSSGQCQPCMGNCIQCRTSTICSQCQPGYTLMQGHSEGMCIKCQKPCKTCLGSPNNCLSCASGSSKQGWSCRNNTKFLFTFTLNDNIEAVMANIHLIKRGCLQHINSNNQDDIVFDSIQSGSTIISGSGQVSNGQDIQQAAHAFSQGVASGIPGTNYTASNVNIQVQEGKQESQESNQRKIAMIAGIIIAVVITILIAVVIFCVVRSRRRQNTQQFEQHGGAINSKQTPSESTGKDRRKTKIQKLSCTDTANNLGTSSMSSVRYPNLDKDMS